MKIMFLDTEVYSDVDLRKTGAAKYFEHATTRPILVTFKRPGKRSAVWDTREETIPVDLAAAIVDPHTLFVAFNAPFDMAAMEKLRHPIPLERWRCLQVATLALGFNGTLDDVLERFDIPHRKSREGQRLIRKFCMPQPKSRKVRRWDKHNAPEDWEAFREYATTDVDILEPLYDKVLAAGRMVDWEEWQLDREINSYGLPIDRKLVRAALEALDEERERIVVEMGELTGVENPNSKPQIKAWLRQGGIKLPDMQKATVARALANSQLSDAQRRVLELQQLIAKSSTSKWDAMERALQDDGRLRNTHQYLGAARTGRDAHRLIQPGNLPRGSLHDSAGAAETLIEQGLPGIELIYGDPMETLSSILRCAITAPGGKHLCVADLAGIEGRVLPWQCRFTQKLEKIANGLDMYKVAAEDILSVPYDQVNKDQRFIGKVAELALGYQGAVGALNTMGSTYGASFTDDVGLPIVRGWRAKNKPIVKYWYDCERAVQAVISRPGKAARVHHVVFTVKGDFLFAVLPSGRRLAYYKPEYGAEGFSYMGQNQYTRKWERLPSYGGKIVENLTQAISRDVFFHGLRRYHDHPSRTGHVVLRVHDELVSETDGRFAVQELALLIKCMTIVPDWAEGLPLAAEGFITERYRK